MADHYSPEPVEEAPSDELMERYARLGMTRALAQVIAADFANTRVMDADKIQSRAVQAVLNSEGADTVKLMIHVIYEAQKPRLACGALLLALGIKPHGTPSMRALAEEQSVGPEHVSNLVKGWQRRLGLGRVEFQKSPEAVASYKTHFRSNAKRRGNVPQ